MYKAQIDKLHGDGVLQQLNESLGGSLSEQWGESKIEINNGIGKGTIRSIDFDWGVSFIEYDIQFNEEFTITTTVGKTTPLVFFYISEGSLQYCTDSRPDRTIKV